MALDWTALSPMFCELTKKTRWFQRTDQRPSDLLALSINLNWKLLCQSSQRQTNWLRISLPDAFALPLHYLDDTLLRLASASELSSIDYRWSCLAACSHRSQCSLRELPSRLRLFSRVLLQVSGVSHERRFSIVRWEMKREIKKIRRVLRTKEDFIVRVSERDLLSHLILGLSNKKKLLFINRNWWLFSHFFFRFCTHHNNLKSFGTNCWRPAAPSLNLPLPARAETRESFWAASPL